MRRCGVGPWLATVVAGTYVLFGPVVDDILWAFQIGFTLSMVLGLSQMLLADHDGDIDRRDWYGLALGGLALLTSGQAPPLILATGIAVLWRRGWRQAAFHTVPLGIIYGIWYVLAGASLHSLEVTDGVTIPSATVGDVGHFVWTAALSLFESVGHFPIIDYALFALLVVGSVLAWRSTSGAARARRLGMPVGLLTGAAVGMIVAAPARFWISPDAAAASRYVGVTVAMGLPLLAVAGDALIRRWRYLSPVIFALFLIPVPWAVASLTPRGLPNGAYYRSLKAWVSTLPTVPGFNQVPAWVEPNSTSAFGTPDLTVGWLREAARQGKLPAPGKINPFAATEVPIQLGVAERGGRTPSGLTCTTSTRPMALDPHLGDVWRLGSDLQVSLRAGTKAGGLPLTFTPNRKEALIQITLPNLKLLVSPAAGMKSFRLCT
jgi:hypothetical protein